ncbi:MAG: nuclear transport factor 2 family protein [Planctomycetota bacterium]|nr:nuclear transport factor 2 family protein [Planctomycetota bacterium]
MNTTMTPSETATVARRLTGLCNAGNFSEAMQELYADNARHIEAMEIPGSPYKRITEGKANLLKMSELWCKTNTVHSASCSAPLVNGDQFVCEMKMDVTCGEGPMAGQRMNMNETCLYTVANGKITEAKFFYGCDM